MPDTISAVRAGNPYPDPPLPPLTLRHVLKVVIRIDVAVTDPKGDEVIFPEMSSNELLSKHQISLALEGSNTALSDRDGDGKPSAGNVAVFTLTVTNSGGVDLTEVEVQDVALEGLVCQQFIPAAIGEMLVGMLSGGGFRAYEDL